MKNFRKNGRKYDVPNHRFYKKEPVPAVGNRYVCFQDGKVSLGRRYVVVVDRIETYRSVDESVREEWKREMKKRKEDMAESHLDLTIFDKRSDFFVHGTVVDGNSHFSGEWYCRSHGGWMCLCTDPTEGNFYPFGGGRLYTKMPKEAKEYDSAGKSVFTNGVMFFQLFDPDWHYGGDGKDA